ncbi:MAG: hypothetical protein NVV69_14670 [Methyloversatilis sp.]|uniref:hypothetical protein n=1 Tax=Methyloversatilis TaxID=378210 RepID=UPI0025FCECD4|nr:MULTISPECIES: hypothetical protein [Methyloversatilis]MBV5286976.1 hypothetical protein [Methyloversatilis discipulorum]MCR6667219.1 hypothetical protein [Methyloversatilis sp.]
MSTSELRIRLAADGRIECRKGDAAPAITLDPDFFGNPESAEAQRALGRFVFAVLQGVTPAADADAPAAADPNSPDALYQNFVTLQSEAMKSYSANMLAMAEQALQQSAAAGFGPAVEAMKDWPSIRSVADMLIARGPEQKN